MPELPAPPPIAGEPLSLVLLAHDAGSHVETLLREWHRTLQARKVAFEILLVDEGSSDSTVAQVWNLIPTLAEVRLVRLEKARGSGAALRAAFDEVAHPLVAVAPCDPAYRPADLSRFLAQIDQVHFLNGYRAGTRVPALWRGVGLLWRKLLRVVFNITPAPLPGWLGWRGHLGALLARVFLGVRLHDVTCPYRVFRKEVLTHTPLQSSGEFAWVEQLAKVNFTNHYVQEVPLELSPSRGRPDPRWFREALRVFSHPTFLRPERSLPVPPAPSPGEPLALQPEPPAAPASGI